MKIINGRASADGPLSDSDLTSAMRELYAAPVDDGYWTSLEGRIMARVRQAEEQGEWWSVFAEWRAAGLVAAALMLTLAGAALWKESRLDHELNTLAAGAAAWTEFDGDSDDLSIAFTVPITKLGQDASASRYLFTAEP